MKKENKYFYIDYDKEIRDSTTLTELITADGWVDKSTILVNCFPEYSSRLTHFINHHLSPINKNELFEVIDVQIPYPNMIQVWNPLTKTYQARIPYLAEWVKTYLQEGGKYLFVISDILTGEELSKVRPMVKNHIDYRFACLYVEEGSTFTPDYYVEKFNKQSQGTLLFQWENRNSPNWE